LNDIFYYRYLFFGNPGGLRVFPTASLAMPGAGAFLSRPRTPDRHIDGSGVSIQLNSGIP
jgi:hypothetical protein